MTPTPPVSSLALLDCDRLDPAFGRLDFEAIFREGASPNGLKNAGENAAPVAMGQARRLDEHSVRGRPLPILSSFSDEASA
jgi:hypothetical protein